jgi:hypothetical protein
MTNSITVLDVDFGGFGGPVHVLVPPGVHLRDLHLPKTGACVLRRGAARTGLGQNHFEMDSPREDEDHSGEIQQHDEFQFDPDCTLILYGLNGRNPKGLLKKFMAIGPVTFWQPVLQYDTAIVAFPNAQLALLAKETIEGEKILFCTVRSDS